MKKIIISILGLAVIGAGAYFVFQRNASAPSSHENEEVSGEIALESAQSLEQLKEKLRLALEAKSTDDALNLYYLEGADERIKESLAASFAALMRWPIGTIESGAASGASQYTLEGVTYRTNLPITNVFKVPYTPDSAPDTQPFVSLYVGNHNGSYYLVTTVPIENPVLEGIVSLRQDELATYEYEWDIMLSENDTSDPTQGFQIVSRLISPTPPDSTLDPELISKVLVDSETIQNNTSDPVKIDFYLNDQATLNPNGPRSHQYFDLSAGFTRSGVPIQNSRSYATSFSVLFAGNELVSIQPQTSGAFDNGKILIATVETNDGTNDYTYQILLEKVSVQLISP